MTLVVSWHALHNRCYSDAGFATSHNYISGVTQILIDVQARHLDDSCIYQVLSCECGVSPCCECATPDSTLYPKLHSQETSCMSPMSRVSVLFKIAYQPGVYCNLGSDHHQKVTEGITITYCYSLGSDLTTHTAGVVLHSRVELLFLG